MTKDEFVHEARAAARAYQDTEERARNKRILRMGVAGDVGLGAFYSPGEIIERAVADFDGQETVRLRGETSLGLSVAEVTSVREALGGKYPVSVKSEAIRLGLPLTKEVIERVAEVAGAVEVLRRERLEEAKWEGVLIGWRLGRSVREVTRDVARIGRFFGRGK